jgi:hypothetical protein
MGVDVYFNVLDVLRNISEEEPFKFLSNLSFASFSKKSVS